jgi:5-methylcytosine-specific restriction endonuclease McrA
MINGMPDKEYKAAYYQRNKKRILLRRQVFEKQPEVIERRRIYHQKWYMENRTRLLALQKAYQAANIEKKHERGRVWFQKNRARKLLQNKLWRDSHIEEQNMFSRRRRIRKQQVGGKHTVSDWLNVKRLFDYRCAICGRSEPDISLTEDHKIPVVKGGTDNIDNIQPLCRSCNSSKATHTWFACRPVDKTWPIDKSLTKAVHCQ